MANTRLRLLNGEHIFYYTEDPESYIKNAVKYIISGVEQGYFLFVIENASRIKEIHNRLKNQLTEKQLANVHHTDNAAFYNMHGDFHTPTIIEHFNQLLEPFKEKNPAIRTWSHVEWKDQDDIVNKIDTFESCGNQCVNEAGVVSVCAYDSVRVPNSLKKALMTNHEFYMTDKKIGASSLFNRLVTT